VHLVIDVEVNHWVHELVRTARAHQSAIASVNPKILRV
jgi:hypothetical protein